MPAAYDTGAAVVDDFVDGIETASFSPSGSDRLLLALAAAGSPFSTPDPPNNIRAGGSGGTALTAIGAAFNAGGMQLLLGRLVPGPSGSTTVYQNGSGLTVNTAIAAMTFTGVDQTTPVGTRVTNSGSTTGASTTATLSWTGLVAGQRVAAYFSVSADSNFDLSGFTANSGSLRQSAYVSDFQYMGVAAVEGAADGSGNATLSVNFSAGSSGTLQWGAIGVPINDAAGGSTIESRTLSSAGAASPSFQSAAIAAVTLSSAGAATPSFQAAAINARTLSSAGAATPTFSSATVLQASLSSAGAGAASFASSAGFAASLSSAGVGAFTPLSSALFPVTLGSAGVAAVSFVGEDANSAVAARTVSSAGVATVNFASAALVPVVLSSQGAAAASFVSQQVGVIAAAFTMSGQASATFQSEALGQRSGSGGKNWAMRAWQDDLLEPYVVEARLAVDAGARAVFVGRAVKGRALPTPVASRIVTADLVVVRRTRAFFAATQLVRDGALLRTAKPLRLIRHTCTHCGGPLHP